MLPVLLPLPKIAWNMIKDMVKVRSIYFYWLNITVTRLYAPGGRGRLDDLNEFNAYMNELNDSIVIHS
tara:strand:- start:226 stop:429 length:204 start_codon:yes stop_codon:yes gene_type:complete